MARTLSFDGVSPKVWERLKVRSSSEHGTRYEPPDSNAGISRTRTVLGTLVLAFDYRPSVQHLTYTIQEKPLLLGEGAIWSGIRTAIDRCQR
jgi:hypothetical protein